MWRETATHEHSKKKEARVLSWLESNVQTQEELDQLQRSESDQAQAISLAASTKRTTSPTSSEIDEIWKEDDAEEQARRATYIAAKKAAEEFGIPMDSSEIETNKEGGIPGASFGQEGQNRKWRDCVKGNYDYATHERSEDLGLSVETQPTPTADRTFVDGLKAIEA